MNKSISISLGGRSFFIEEDAYSKLHQYLIEVKNSLNTAEDETEEILKDVETRIAELFTEWLGIHRQVIDDIDVDKMISIMGTPEQYNSEDEGTDYSNTSSKEQNSDHAEKGKFYQRQLFRDVNDKIIGGVCSGISHFFGIQPIWLRLAMVLLLFFSGWLSEGLVPTIILGYIVLLIVIPKAKTTSDKLKMKGKPINFDSIKEYVNKEELVEQSGKIKNNISKASNGIGHFLETLFKLIVNIISMIAGVICLLIGFLLLFAYIIGTLSDIYESNSPYHLMDFVFDSPWQLYTMIILCGLFIVISCFYLILFGLRLITRKKIIKLNMAASITLLFIWLTSLIITPVFAFSFLVSNYSSNVERANKYVLNLPSDTLTVTMNSTDFTSPYMHNRRFNVNSIKGIVFTSQNIKKKLSNKLEIRQSNDSNAYIQIINSASGKTEAQALKNLSEISYNYNSNNNVLNLDSYFLLPKNAKFREQQIELVLFLPKNKYLKTHNVKKVIYNEHDEHNIFIINDNLSNKVFKFADDNLECINCSEFENEISDSQSETNISINRDGIKIRSKK
ncbi:PspC domain-containing protein [Apibacter raozihei]|uniref:PspC domain-containing protein n=1 Tax=Apibacter raozihei TaxID=2500547 RepID=UPI000FE2E0BC|nr:PspC domain-containing protein [Apibacter raozihei]